MGAVVEVLAKSPGWFSSLCMLFTLGGVCGMYIMMTITSRRIGRIEKVCKERLTYCHGTFQRSGEADIRHDGLDGRLERIEDKLDHIMMKNGWS